MCFDTCTTLNFQSEIYAYMYIVYMFSFVFINANNILVQCFNKPLKYVWYTNLKYLRSLDFSLQCGLWYYSCKNINTV